MYYYNKITYHREPIYLKTKDDVNEYILPANDEPDEYIDFKNNIRYNHQYISHHPESYGAIYFVTQVLRINNQVKIKIQFIPGLHEVMISLKAFESNMVYDPYYMNMFYGFCCIGNMKPEDLEKYKDEFEFWKAYMSRLYDPEDPYYPVFGGNGYLPVNLNFVVFQHFHEYNELLVENNKIPIVDINDQGLYMHPYCIFTRAHRSITRQDAMDLSKLPIDGHKNIALPMRIRELPLWCRDKSLLKKPGRPKKAKEEQESKIQLYRIIKDSNIDKFEQKFNI